ncbi:MAG TPA: response regulator [Polyangiaceae bacterium]
MRRIVFVDDEQGVLDGLQNLLRKQRKQWDMVFALGGAAALAELAQKPADVVVTDMRMPGMDGASLLERIRELYPATTRIVLSGHAEREAVVRAVPVTHQFLSKPCEGEALRAVIERACGLQNLLTDANIRALVAGVDHLPSAPDVYFKLTQALAKPDTSITEVSAIVQEDPAISAKILQLVNSAYFGLPQRVATLQHAVSYLGVDPIKALSLSAHVFGTFEGAKAGLSIDHLQKFSLLTASCAKRFAADKKLADEAFTSGLVHDVGRLTLAMRMPAEFQAMQRTAASSGRPAHVIEREQLGASHAEVGAYLLGAWGLPLSVVEAVAFHHNPSAIREGAREILAVVHVADALVDHAVSPSAPLEELGLDLAFLEEARLLDRVPEWRRMAAEAMRKAGERESSR